MVASLPSSVIQMSDLSLTDLLPGFGLDRDEEWMIYLSAEKQSFIRKQREKFLAINEHLENFRITFQKYLEDNRDFDDVTVRMKTQEFHCQRNEFLKKRDENSKCLIPKIRELKKEALRLKAKALKRDQQRANGKKKPRFEEPDIIEIDNSDVDLVEDDYLPNLIPDYSKDIVEPVPMETATTPPMSPNLNRGRRAAKNQPQDQFLSGCDEMEAEILLQLKSLIDKYNCRDRALRAIRSFKSRDKSIKAMEIFTKSIAMAKEDPSFRHQMSQDAQSTTE